MRESKYERDLERLEKARRHTYDRLEKERLKIEERFDRLQERLERKAGEPSMTQERIIETALELLKEGGLANLTQRKLATKLDMQAPALYWHFKNKQVLVDYLAEAILAKGLGDFQPRGADQRWQDWLIEHMLQLRGAMLAYPDGGRVVAGAHLYPATMLAKSLEYSLISLHSAGIDLKTARTIVVTATTYTFGCVIEEQAAPTAEELAQIDVAAFLEPYPHIAQSFDGNDQSSEGQTQLYRAGLEMIIAGASSAHSTEFSD